MTDCVFCRVVAGELPSKVVLETDVALAFLDTSPATKGHTLVVPKLHVTDLLSAPEGAVGGVMEAARLVALHLEERLPLEGVTLVQTNRAAGWQDVFHLHLHVVPRYAEDGLVRPWKPRRAKPAALAEVHDLLV